MSTGVPFLVSGGANPSTFLPLLPLPLLPLLPFPPLYVHTLAHNHAYSPSHIYVRYTPLPVRHTHTLAFLKHPLYPCGGLKPPPTLASFSSVPLSVTSVASSSSIFASNLLTTFIQNHYSHRKLHNPRRRRRPHPERPLYPDALNHRLPGRPATLCAFPLPCAVLQDIPLAGTLDSCVSPLSRRRVAPRT